MSAYKESITPPGTEHVWDEDPTNPTTNQFATHWEAERHYDAARQSTIDLKIRLDAYQNKYGYNFEAPAWTGGTTPTPPGDGTFLEGTEVHFGGGMLHKPVADSGGAMVLVMAEKYCEASKNGMRVTLLSSTGTVIENQLRFTGCANGNRPNHRSSKKAKELVQYAPLYYTWKYQGQPQYLVVPNPEQRYE